MRLDLDPLYRRMVPRIVLPLGERLGRRMWTEARRLTDLQWWSPGDLEAWNVQRLQRLVSHAAAHVPYYRARLKRTGVTPGDLRALKDLSRFPVTTKAELRAEFPTGTTADNLPERRRQRMMTSGSSGLPFELYWDRAAAELVRGTYLFFLEWAGAAVWDARIVIASPAYFYNHVATSPWLRRLAGRLVLGERSHSLSADELTTARVRTLVREVSRWGRYFIRGYPAPIARLAAQLVEEDEPLRSHPRVVVTFAETLTPANVAGIGQAFRCPVVNYYSSWEVPQMAQTCPDNPGLLHVNGDRVILRVVRPDGTDAPPGERGQVVVTDLANFVMPFINYSNGDQAVAGPACPCGRGFSTLASLEGRDTEVIRTPDGRCVNGVILGQYLAFVAGAIPYVWEYQAIQTAPDVVQLRLVPSARFSSEFAKKLEGDLEAFLGPGMTVTIQSVDRIPLEPSGKRLIIKHGGA
ncbi:MAG: phenylacetate--CoA ligase family protein [Candidatus Rokuibacteriota bacterium]